MSCGCGRAATRREMLRTTSNMPTRDGGFSLATYPNCTTLHHGEFQGESVYIVGRNTEFERLFRRADLAEATEYTITTRQQIENIPTSGLCDEAVLDLLAV